MHYNDDVIEINSRDAQTLTDFIAVGVFSTSYKGVSSVEAQAVFNADAVTPSEIVLKEKRLEHGVWLENITSAYAVVGLYETRRKTKYETMKDPIRRACGVEYAISQVSYLKNVIPETVLNGGKFPCSVRLMSSETFDTRIIFDTPAEALRWLAAIPDSPTVEGIIKAIQAKASFIYLNESIHNFGTFTGLRIGMIETLITSVANGRAKMKDPKDADMIRLMNDDPYS